MKITSFKSEIYKKHEVYIRTFGYYFEFLIVLKGKIHTAHIRMQPDFKNRVLYLLGQQDLPYSKKQLPACKMAVMQLAQQVIDELSSKK